MTTLFTRSAAGLFSVLVLMSAGCSQSTVIPSAGPRPPTSPSDVAILTEPPDKYQLIEVVESTQNLRWGPDAQIDPVMDDLRAKAAAVGATALLLRVDSAPARATGMYRSKTYQVPIDGVPATKAMAAAIYVIDD